MLASPATHTYLTHSHYNNNHSLPSHPQPPLSLPDFTDASISALLAPAPLPTPTDPHPTPDTASADRIDARLIVLCGNPAIDPSIAALARDAALVLDKGIVVDGAFRTNDPCVLAAGPVARFSSRYGQDLRMRHMHSVEVGECLGMAIRAHFR